MVAELTITLKVELPVLGDQAHIHEHILRRECRATTVKAALARLDAEAWQPGDRVVLEIHAHELRQIRIVRAATQLDQPACAAPRSPVWFFGLFALLDSGYGQLEFHLDAAGAVTHDRTTYSLRLGDQAVEDVVAAFVAARGSHPDDRIAQDGTRLVIQRTAAPELVHPELSRTV